MRAVRCRDSNKTRYIPNVRELVRKYPRFFILATIAGVLLRLIFIFYFPSVTTDSFVYGDLAKNWLQHGVFGLSGTGGVSPTDIRLPGYPAFLALIFSIFGMEHYRAILFTQLFIDLGTTLVCADLTRRILGERAAKVAFLLTVLCPFLADYSAAALTETLEIFFTALALDFAVLALQKSSLRAWAGCGAFCAAATLLRPDGLLLLIVIDLYLLTRMSFPSGRSALPSSRWFASAALVTAITLAPLVPWTVRNWRVMHRVQPLAPRYANEENQFVPMGFNRWTKTWIADYVSVEEVYWSIPGSTIDVNDLPNRAFDTPQQHQETERIIAEYNQALHISPQLDKQFEALAAQRICSHPLRYYIRLPLVRIADMWLRPRTEILPSDTRWWEFNDDPRWSTLAVGLEIVGLFYVGSALAGWWRERHLGLGGLLVWFVILRSLFLGSLENPEPRYTLEMYPVVILFAAAAWTHKSRASGSDEEKESKSAASQSF